VLGLGEIEIGLSDFGEFIPAQISKTTQAESDVEQPKESEAIKVHKSESELPAK
jgi:hypothetical protein